MAFNRPNQQFRGRMRIEEPPINNEIRNYPQVRVVYKERSGEKSPNDFTQVMSMYEARKLSEEKVLDLILINAQSGDGIPVIRLMDYNKYLWELKNSMKQKAKTTTPAMKEVQLSVNISQHDLEVKARKAREFIEDGSKVKVVLQMKGRELSRRNYSKESFREFIALLADVAIPEGPERNEGKRVIIILKKKNGGANLKK